MIDPHYTHIIKPCMSTYICSRAAYIFVRLCKIISWLGGACTLYA